MFKKAALLFLLLTVFASVAYADESCVTEKCHSDIAQGKFIHGPVAVKQCEVCHVPTGQHTFKLVADNIAETCYKCHDMLGSYSPEIHSHLNQRGCTQCHDPHRASNKYQIRSNVAETCSRCHGTQGDQ
jgi:predicted CXXCH cytochrome family protein